MAEIIVGGKNWFAGTATDPIEVRIGSDQPVTVEKEYGPAIFATLRITPDINGVWVIERQRCHDGKWIPWITIPAQVDDDFTEDNGKT